MSNVFWDTTERNNAINDACRFIAGVTKGVPEVVTGALSYAAPYLTFTGTPVGEYVTAGVAGDSGLTSVPMPAADAMYPAWRSARGEPKWAIVDTREKRVYVAPIPTSSTTATVTVAVLPPEVTSDAEELFMGHAAMERYQTAMLNIAAAYCLLRERYDGDAERFWQFALGELQTLGVAPNTVPSLREAAS